jgi:serine/threonine-protein kinase
MGEVYRARDTRLDRTVAIKVLPTELSADPERRARFEREARAIAALNHPHICTLHDIGTHDSTTYLVMEHLPGQTLADRLLKGPVPLVQALDVAAQIAEALDVAHKHGIIHRDLKPGNVMLTSGGAGRSGVTTAKLLDFGLAKLAAHGERPALVSETYAVTEAAPVTARGTILGTLQYMAPEQLEGKEADARTDLWALGAILYEMVTGRRAFEGESQVSLVGNIMNAEPAALVTLQPLTPPALERVVKKCLAKHPDDRFDTAHDLADELRWTAQVGGAAGQPDAHSPRRSGIRAAVAAAGVSVGILIGAASMWVLRPVAPAHTGVVRSLVSVAPADRLHSVPADLIYGEQRPSQHAIALSPDGRFLVFSAMQGEHQQLYLRPVDRLDAAPIGDTDGAASPFFSPDGKWIGFWANGALRKVAAAGGPATTICEAERLFGASWGDDDTIVYAGYLTALFQVPAAGGTPRQLTALDARKGEVSHRLPHLLPGARAVIFTAVTHYLPDWNGSEIVVQPIPGGARKTVTRGADARYVPTGHLLFVRFGTAVAAPFDLQRLELTGGVVTVMNDVMQAANTPNSTVESGAAQLTLSSSGLLAYATGGIFRDQERLLVWVDRNGREEPLPLPARAYLGPHLSPDGERVVLWTQGQERLVWVYDLRRGTMTRVTAEGRNSRAIWEPDGRRVTYASATSGEEVIVSKAADGSGDAKSFSVRGQPSSWSPEGQALAFVWSLEGGRSKNAVFLLRIGDEEPRPFVSSRSTELYPEFSPDGRWIAYTSDETGRQEVYAQPYPGPGERRQLSNNGGTQPAWAHNGRELFYTEIDARPQRMRMMSVPLVPGAQLRAGVPHALFDGPFRDQANTRGYDVTADGQRFLMVKPVQRPPSPVTQLVLVQNWFEELKAKVPAGEAGK